MKSRAPTKAEKAHMDAVAELGCIVCWNEYQRFSPAAIHHTIGKTRKGAHFKVLPLCGKHHQTGGYGVALHAGKAEFERLYGTEQELLEQVEKMLKDDAWHGAGEI